MSYCIVHFERAFPFSEIQFLEDSKLDTATNYKSQNTNFEKKKYDLAAILEANEPILWGKFGRYTQHKLMTNCCFRNCTLITFAVQQKNHMISNRISLVAENFPEKQIPRRPCVGSAVPCS